MTAEPERFSHRLARHSTLLPIRKQTRRERLALFLMGACLLIFALTVTPTLKGQSCPKVGIDGGSSLAGGATVEGTSQPVTNEMVLPRGTMLRFDAIASVAGECQNYMQQCTPAPCTCVLNSTYERTVNHIYMWMDVTSAGSLNGEYTVGYVFGLNPDGTTASYAVLDTQASNSTGPVYETLTIRSCG